MQAEDSEEKEEHIEKDRVTDGEIERDGGR